MEYINDNERDNDPMTVRGLVKARSFLLVGDVVLSVYHTA
jgi:hypothetical protein